MYVCLDCANLFEEPRCYTETHGLEFAPFESWRGCPKCAGAYITTIYCDHCGGWVTGEYIKLKDGAVICDQCYEIMNVEDNY